MKSTKTFLLSKDAKKIMFDVFNGEIELKQADAFYIDCGESDFRLESKDTSLYVSRPKKIITTQQKAKITVYVPEQINPDVKIKAKNSNVDMDEGAYNSVTIDVDRGKVTLKGTTTNILVVKGEDINVEIIDISVSDSVMTNMSGGEILLNDGFITHADITIKDGNIGVWESDFKEMELYANKGNIQILLAGGESDYTFKLTTKNGIKNREDLIGGDKTIKAHASHGNVYVDMVDADKKKESEKDENDDVTEALSL